MINVCLSKTDYEDSYTLLVQDSHVGIRLDKWLAENLSNISRSRIQSLIIAGQVSINDTIVITTNYKLKLKDSCSINIPFAITYAEPKAEAIAIDVVYEDEQLIVINKQAGMVVHPATSNHSSTLVNALLHHCGNSLSGIGGIKRPGIVHRLDKDTSGLLVVAKTDAAHYGLAEQFSSHTLTRAYYALCWGVPLPHNGEINGNIRRSFNNRKKMEMVKSGGKLALTRYYVQKAFSNNVALVECRLSTGRTHQIRVHMTAIGHPLIGDPLYCRRTKRDKDLPVEIHQQLIDFPRQALHAFLLGFLHPITGESLLFERKPPQDLNNLISSLKNFYGGRGGIRTPGKALYSTTV